MTEATPAAALAERLAALAATLPGTASVDAGGATSWSLGSTVFAVVAGGGVQLRLDAAVAAAALKTPDTAASERGPEWVRYAPRTLEGHDLDRLTAWFALAHRRAGQPADQASRASR